MQERLTGCLNAFGLQWVQGWVMVQTHSGSRKETTYPAAAKYSPWIMPGKSPLHLPSKLSEFGYAGPGILILIMHMSFALSHTYRGLACFTLQIFYLGLFKIWKWSDEGQACEKNWRSRRRNDRGKEVCRRMNGQAALLRVRACFNWLRTFSSSGVPVMEKNKSGSRMWAVCLTTDHWRLVKGSRGRVRFINLRNSASQVNMN